MMGKVSQAYDTGAKQITWFRVGLLGVILITTIIVMRRTNPFDAVNLLGNDEEGKYIQAVTWNVAAVNNNPFEYWITNSDPSYNSLMKNVSNFIENPGSFDIKVNEVFTEQMYSELNHLMTFVGKFEGLEETRNFWENNYQNRKIISEFIKDGAIGKKRLASMPDRITNTINTLNEGTVMRPTVINCFEGDLGTIPKWWEEWKKFYFTKEIEIKKSGETKKMKIFEMVPKLSKAKYPDVTELEEKVSIPLETLCLAIFDAILVHMMTQVGPNTWQPLRNDMCTKLNKKKADRTVEILDRTYSDADVQFLQEVAGNFKSFAETRPIGDDYDIYAAASMDTDRDQNSFVLLKKDRFRDVIEVTEEVKENYKKANNGVQFPVVNGDLVVITAIDNMDNTKYLFASFHGDTNGLATKPVVTAVRSYAVSFQPDAKMLFGMDANTYAKPQSDQQGVVDFAEFYTANKLNSCYGPHPNPMNFTTFHARTHLQPQLNKAVSLEEKDLKGDKNPKDFIIFFESDFRVVSTSKDNTGDKKYIENMVFPTLTFPSDHGVTSTVLKELSATKKNLK